MNYFSDENRFHIYLIKEMRTSIVKAIQGVDVNKLIRTISFRVKREMIATGIGVVSPYQEVEGRYTVYVDYGDPVRKGIYRRFGKAVFVIVWLGRNHKTVRRGQVSILTF